VPGGIIKKWHMEGDVKVIDSLEVTSFALTTQPVDKTLPPAQIIG
jgi:hypothetical protein